MHFEEDKHSLTFRFDSNDGERHLEMNCNELFLGDILDRFKEFLQGCGYVIDGQLEVGPSWNDFEKHTDDTKFDFSNIPNNNWPFGSSTPSTTSYASDPEPDSKKVYSPYVPTSDK